MKSAFVIFLAAFIAVQAVPEESEDPLLALENNPLSLVEQLTLAQKDQQGPSFAGIGQALPQLGQANLDGSTGVFMQQILKLVFSLMDNNSAEKEKRIVSSAYVSMNKSLKDLITVYPKLSDSVESLVSALDSLADPLSNYTASVSAKNEFPIVTEDMKEGMEEVYIHLNKSLEYLTPAFPMLSSMFVIINRDQERISKTYPSLIPLMRAFASTQTPSFQQVSPLIGNILESVASISSLPPSSDNSANALLSFLPLLSGLMSYQAPPNGYLYNSFPSNGYSYNSFPSNGYSYNSNPFSYNYGSANFSPYSTYGFNRPQQ